LHDAAIFHSDVALHDAPVVEHNRVGDDQIECAVVGLAHRAAALAHAVADHLAAPEGDLVAVVREVLLDLDDQLGVGEADAVARGRTIQVGIDAARDVQAHRAFSSRTFLSARSRAPAASSVPPTAPRNPWITRAPPTSVTSTSFSSPGSKRTAVPAAMLRRMP